METKAKSTNPTCVSSQHSQQHFPYAFLSLFPPREDIRATPESFRPVSPPLHVILISADSAQFDFEPASDWKGPSVALKVEILVDGARKQSQQGRVLV